MKSAIDRCLPLCLAWVLAQTQGLAQGLFLNLNFEHPIFPFVQRFDGLVAASNAIPHWTASAGTNQMDWVGYNDLALGGAAISLHGLGSPWQAALHGQYCVVLQPQWDGSVSPALAQQGTVPSYANSLCFYGYDAYGGSISVSFDGQPIPLVILGSTTICNIFGGDISAFAGQTGWLRFEGGGVLDNIYFSTQPIPEPGTLTLFGLGGLVVAGVLLRRRHRQAQGKSP